MLNSTNLTGKDTRAALRVIDALNRRSTFHCRTDSERRSNPREPFPTLITIVVSTGESESVDSSQSFDVWARNISRSGISFIHSQRLNGKEIVVKLQASHDNPVLIGGEIVNARELENDSWEYGVLFRERLI